MWLFPGVILRFLSKVCATPAHWVHGLFKGGVNGFCFSPWLEQGLYRLVSLKKKVVVLIAWHVMLVPNSSHIWFHQGRLGCRYLAGHLVWHKRESKRPWNSSDTSLKRLLQQQCMNITAEAGWAVCTGLWDKWELRLTRSFHYSLPITILPLSSPSLWCLGKETSLKPRMGTAGAVQSLWTVAYTVCYIRQLGECWMYLEINFLWWFYVFCMAPVNTSKQASEAAASSWGMLLFPAGVPKMHVQRWVRKLGSIFCMSSLQYHRGTWCLAGKHEISPVWSGAATA